MITPVNGHVLIEPVRHEAFMASQQESYQEIGVVVAVDEDHNYPGWHPEVGERVYFDAWLAAKYPKEGGADGEFYWLVKWEDVRAAEAVPEAGEFSDDALPE